MPKAKKASQLTKALPKVKTGAKMPGKSPSKGTGGKPLLKAAREVQLTPKEAEEAEEWAAAQARVVARFKEMREEARRGNFEMIPLEKSLYNYTALDSAARHAFEVDGYQGASVQPSTRTGRIKAKVEDIVECFQLMQKMPFRNQLDSLTFKPKQIICFGLGQLVCDEFTSKQKSRHDFRFESSPALVEHVVACEWNRHNTNTSFQMAWLLVAQKHFDGCQVLVYDPAHSPLDREVIGSFPNCIYLSQAQAERAQKDEAQDLPTLFYMPYLPIPVHCGVVIANLKKLASIAIVGHPLPRLIQNPILRGLSLNFSELSDREAPRASDFSEANDREAPSLSFKLSTLPIVRTPMSIVLKCADCGAKVGEELTQFLPPETGTPSQSLARGGTDQLHPSFDPQRFPTTQCIVCRRCAAQPLPVPQQNLFAEQTEAGTPGLMV